MSTFNQIPKFDIPTTDGKFTNKSWYFFWQAQYIGIPQAAIEQVTVTGTPFSFQAKIRGSLIVQGGSVSQVSFSRDGINNFVTGQTQGMFPVNAGDYLIISYGSVPNLTFVPS